MFLQHFPFLKAPFWTQPILVFECTLNRPKSHIPIFMWESGGSEKFNGSWVPTWGKDATCGKAQAYTMEVDFLPQTGMESVGTERSGRQTAAAKSPLVVRPDTGPVLSWPLRSSLAIRIVGLFTLRCLKWGKRGNCPTPPLQRKTTEPSKSWGLPGPRGVCIQIARFLEPPAPRGFPLCQEVHCPEAPPTSLRGCELYLPVTSGSVIIQK